MKTYKVYNVSGTDIAIGGVYWRTGESKTLTKAQLNDDIIAATDAGTTLRCDTDLSPLGGLTTMTNGMSTGHTYNGGGTPIARNAGALTIPAITADATVQNAFATLFVELAHVRTALNSVIAQIEALKSNT